MNITSKVTSFALVTMALGSSLVIQPISAASASPVAQLAQQRIENRCNLVTQRVDIIITKYDSTKQLHINRYQTIKAKVQTLVTNLSAKGYDVAKLQADLTKLNELTLTFAAQYDQSISQLKESKAMVCGQSNGDYKAKVQEARATLLTARSTSLDIRLLINTTIKADIQSLKDQVKK